MWSIENRKEPRILLRSCRGDAGGPGSGLWKIKILPPASPGPESQMILRAGDAMILKFLYGESNCERQTVRSGESFGSTVGRRCRHSFGSTVRDTLPAASPLQRAITIFVFFLIGLIFLSSCALTRSTQPAEDLLYGTPIPERTFRAYQSSKPVPEQFQAANAAIDFVGHTRLESLQTPEVLLVEKITLSQAKKMTEGPGVQSYEGIPLDTPVWFVIMKGVWRVHPPDPEHTITPLPPLEGCQYVWMPVDAELPRTTGGIDCPEGK
jgi:hypothetical protein